MWQVETILGVSLDENLEMIESTTKFLVDPGLGVFLALKHFFDGMLQDDYGWACCEAAQRGGAEALVLADTNGGAMSWDVEISQERPRRSFRTSSLRSMPTTTVDWRWRILSRPFVVGRPMSSTATPERCGNADLCAVIGNLALSVVR